MSSVPLRMAGGEFGPQCLDPAYIANLLRDRHIDTSLNYGNQVGTGIAIKKSGIPREELYITTKYDAISGADAATEIHTTLKQVRSRKI